jgi:hypothetical protein
MGATVLDDLDELLADNKVLRADGSFLLDRLDDFEREIQDDNLAREWSGHVSPAIARFRAALSSHKRGDAS